MARVVVQLAIMLSVFTLTLTRAADVISFSPGPGFTTRMHTAAGTFLIDVSPSGNTVWVGTEEEYTTRRASAVLGSTYTEMRVEGDEPHDHTMINRKLPLTRLGPLTLAEIQAALFLSDQAPPHRIPGPRPKKGYQYILLSWTPNRKTLVRAILRDPKSALVFDPFYCQPGACNFQIPKSELGVPLIAIFTAHAGSPAAIAIKSLAHSQYEAETAYEMAIDPAEMQALHAIDPSIPAD